MNDLSRHQTGAVIFTSNVQKVAVFYEAVAGLVPFRVEHDHVRLEKGSFRLTVHRIPAHHAKGISITTPPRIRENAAMKLAFQVENLAHSREAAAQHGGMLYPVEREWHYEDMTACDGHDPDGNVFQLFAFKKEGAA